MTYRLSYGVMALLASSALTQVTLASAQDAETPDAAVEPVAEAEDDNRLDTIVIRGAFIPDEKRETAEVSSLLDAEDFSLRGDSDVAAALRRATGVSIADGRFVIIRGLNERYSSSTLNGSVLPSPEPLRKVTPLDLFPTSVLESTLIQKTFSPEQSAEFGGGSVDIRTKKVPLENFFEIGLSGGGNTETSLQDGFIHHGQDEDWTGFDGGARDLPAGLGEILADGAFASTPTAERSAFSAAITEDPNLLVVQETNIPLDFGVDATIGRRYDINSDFSLGVLGTVSYSNDWSTKEGVQGIGGATETIEFENLIALQTFNRRSTANTIGLNGMLSIGLEAFENHELNFLAFGTRSTDKETEVREGRTNDETGLRRETIEWIERQLWTTQISGQHTFPNLMNAEIDWRGSLSRADRDAPYQFNHQFRTDEDTGITEIFRNQSVEFSYIDDRTTDFGVDGRLPLFVGDMEFEFKAGYAYVEKDRESQGDFFAVNNVLSDCRQLRIDVAYRCNFEAGTRAFQNTRSDQAPAFYVATQEIDAGYVGVDAQLTNFLRASIGGRYEDFLQIIETRTAQNTPGLITPPLEDDTFFPAAVLTWNFADDLQLRVGYSESVTRPQFREVGPSFFTNTETNENYLGNPFLVGTDLTNYDARLEWYFGRDEFFTAGLFYKDLTNPIEAFNVGRGESRLVTFVNIEAAEVQGMELEFQKALPVSEWIGSDNFAGNWLGTKDFEINTNYTYTDSSIEANAPVALLRQSAIPGLLNGLEVPTLVTRQFLIDENALVERNVDFDLSRQLQGQSEHLANLQFGYKDFEAGSSLTFLLNYQSERIRSVESITDGSPAIIEQPPLLVDLVYRRDLTFMDRDFNLGVKVNNLLNDEYEAFQESDGRTITVDEYKLGTSFSVSLKHTF